MTAEVEEFRDAWMEYPPPPPPEDDDRHHPRRDAGLARRGVGSRTDHPNRRHDDIDNDDDDEEEEEEEGDPDTEWGGGGERIPLTATATPVVVNDVDGGVVDTTTAVVATEPLVIGYGNPLEDDNTNVTRFEDDHDHDEDDDDDVDDDDDDDGTVTIRNGSGKRRPRRAAGHSSPNYYYFPVVDSSSHQQQQHGSRSFPLVGTTTTTSSDRGSSNTKNKKKKKKKENHWIIHHADSTFVEEVPRRDGGTAAVLLKNTTTSNNSSHHQDNNNAHKKKQYRKRQLSWLLRNERRRECDCSTSLDAFFGFLFCLALVLTLAVSFGGITSSSDNDNDDRDPSPDKLSGTILPHDMASHTVVPGAAGGLSSWMNVSFQPTHSGDDAASLVHPHVDVDEAALLQQGIRPQTAFGHWVDLDGNGDRFVAALKGGPNQNDDNDDDNDNDNPDYYDGAYQLFRWSVADHDWLWERTLYHLEQEEDYQDDDSLSLSHRRRPSWMDQQMISMNGNGERIAFTQGGEAFLYLGLSGHVVHRFGPRRASWHTVGVALSHWGDTLAVLLSPNDDEEEEPLQPSILQIYQEQVQQQPPSTSVVDAENRAGESDQSSSSLPSWKLVAQSTLAITATQGFLSFGYGAGVDLLAVGMYRESTTTATTTKEEEEDSLEDDDRPPVEEQIDIFSSINGIDGTWSPLGNPQLMANSLLSKFKDSNNSNKNKNNKQEEKENEEDMNDSVVGMGSVFSLSIDGGALAIGSRHGVQNRVVLLRLDTEGEWTAYGTNSVLMGQEENSHFGATLQLDETGKRLFVGAPGPMMNQEEQDDSSDGGDHKQHEKDDTKPSSGGKIFVYQYDTATNTWFPFCEPIVEPPSSSSSSSSLAGSSDHDRFGATFAIDQSGTRVLVGLPHHHHEEEESNASLSYSGAVASYHLVGE